MGTTRRKFDRNLTLYESRYKPIHVDSPAAQHRDLALKRD